MNSLDTNNFPYQHTHDLILGLTLLRNGVKTFYSRNTKDFIEIGFERLVNPIDSV